MKDKRYCVRFDPARRRFLGSAVALAGASFRCGYFPPESGPAFAPWAFPDASLEPRLSLVHAALLAASPHNTQPWWFEVEPEQIEVSLLPDRSLAAMDPLGREQLIGMGCAIENLMLAAPAFGFSPTLELTPDVNRPDLLARVEITPGDEEVSPLFAEIPQRHTNRGAYADLPLPDDVGPQLVELAEAFAPVRLSLLESSEDMQAFREGTNAATRRIVGDTEMSEASHAWWRQTEAQIERHRDGLTLDMAGVGAGTRVLGKAPDQVSAERAGRYWVRNTERTQLSGSAFGILSTPSLEDAGSLLAVGRAWQHLHLWLTSQGAAAQPLNQMAERRDRELQLDLDPEFAPRLERLSEGQAHMLFRVGYGWDDPFASPRRPVAWVSEERA